MIILYGCWKVEQFLHMFKYVCTYVLGILCYCFTLPISRTLRVDEEINQEHFIGRKWISKWPVHSIIYINLSWMGRSK